MRLTTRGRAVVSALTLAILGTVLPSSSGGARLVADVVQVEPEPMLPVPRTVSRVVDERASRSANRDLGRFVADSMGWSREQWLCMDRLFNRESRWSHTAENKTSGAYGIPQKMGTITSEFASYPLVQIQWGANYIKARYGTPCRALRFHLKNGWY